MGGGDVFSFAFRKGENRRILKVSKARQSFSDRRAGSRSAIRCSRRRRRHHQDQVCRCRLATWGTALMSGQGDSALSWEGLRAQWKGQGLDFDYFLGRDFSKLPANSFVIRKSDFEDASKKDMYERYFRGWASGLEFGKNNPRAATQIVMEQFPGLSSQMTPDVASNP